MNNILNSRFGILIQLIGGVALLIIMPLIEFRGLAHKYNNCWFYAMNLWVRKGGYIICEHSEYGWWGHYSHTLDHKTFTCFTTRKKYKRAISPLIFKGYVKKWKLAEPLPLALTIVR